VSWIVAITIWRVGHIEERWSTNLAVEPAPGD
jgi:hypothetical protein